MKQTAGIVDTFDHHSELFGGLTTYALLSFELSVIASAAKIPNVITRLLKIENSV